MMDDQVSQVKRESCDENDDDIRFIESSECALDTTSIWTIEDVNAQGNESNSATALLQANKMHLEKLKEAEEKAKPIIQAIQQKIDESAKGMATRNAKYQKEIAGLEAKNIQENVNFGKEMASLKEQLKEKINWTQVDRVMRKKLATSPLVNPRANRWNFVKTKNSSISISADGLYATNVTNQLQSVSAEKGFTISVDFSGPALFYFEVINMSAYYEEHSLVGLSIGNIPNGSCVGRLPNSYAIHYDYNHYLLSGKRQQFEWPIDAIKPKWNGPGDVIGCGLVLNAENELSIFFTGNGILIGKQIPITSTVDSLYPTVTLYEDASVLANFGDYSAKPFCYDIKKCPGLAFK